MIRILKLEKGWIVERNFSMWLCSISNFLLKSFDKVFIRTSTWMVCWLKACSGKKKLISDLALTLEQLIFLAILLIGQKPIIRQSYPNLNNFLLLIKILYKKNILNFNTHCKKYCSQFQVLRHEQLLLCRLRPRVHGRVHPSWRHWHLTVIFILFKEIPVSTVFVDDLY